MIINEEYTASVVGAGNVAYSLIPALQKNGIIVKSIISRDWDKAQHYGSLFNISANQLEEGLKLESHLIFLTVSDDFIVDTAKQLKIDNNQIILHTSGNVQVGELKDISKYHGVFYPLQSFSGNRMIDFSRVPLCLEASDVLVLNLLQDIAERLSSKVMILSGKQRRQLHLAAVFVSNFTNHMFDIGNYLLEKEKLDFSLFYPLIEEITAKIREMTPKEAQTGPAYRKNKKILAEHKKMLATEQELTDLYDRISKSIIDFH